MVKDRCHSTIYGICIFHKKDINRGGGGVEYNSITTKKTREKIQDNHISRKDYDEENFQYTKDQYEDPYEDSNLKSLEENN